MEFTIPEDACLRELADGPLSVDALSERTGITIGEVSAACMWLEIKARVQRLPGAVFRLSPPAG